MRGGRGLRTGTLLHKKTSGYCVRTDLDYERSHFPSAAIYIEGIPLIRPYGGDNEADIIFPQHQLYDRVAGCLLIACNSAGCRGCESYHDNIHCLYVDLQNCLQLYTGKIYGTRRLWSLGGHGNRLVLPGRLHDGQVLWRKMEIDAEYISRENNRLYSVGRWISLEMRPENQTWMRVFLKESLVNRKTLPYNRKVNLK